MSPLSFTQAAYTDCFPRVSGDEPAAEAPAEDTLNVFPA